MTAFVKRFDSCLLKRFEPMKSYRKLGRCATFLDLEQEDSKLCPDWLFTLRKTN